MSPVAGTEAPSGDRGAEDPSAPDADVGGPTRWRPSRYQWGLVVIGAVALVVRWYEILVVRPECGPDGRGPAGCVAIVAGINDPLYVHLQGNAIADGHWFVDPLWLRSTGEAVASAQKPPLYPLLLGLASWLGLTSVTAHRLVSGVVGVVAVLLIATVAHRLGGHRAGLAAGAIAAIYPMFWVNDLLLQTESLFAAIAAVVLLASYRFWREPSLANAAWLGAAVALATLTRAESALLCVFLVLPLALRARDLAWRDRFVRLVMSGLVTLAVITPWVGWNLSRFEEPVYLSTGAGAVLNTASCDDTYYGLNLGYYGECFDLVTVPVATQRRMCERIDLPADCFADPDQFRRVEDSLQDRHVYDESERELVARDQAVEYIGEHTGRLPVVMAARVGRMWDLYRPAQNVRFNDRLEGRGQRASQVGLALYYVTLPLAVVGAVWLYRRQVTLVPLLAPMLVITLTAALAFGTTRYRIPADVALVVLAGVGLAALVGRWGRRAGQDGRDMTEVAP